MKSKKVLARPGTHGTSILHESASKSASRALRHTPGRGIAARSHLEGSRGLERLPGALFCSRVHVVFLGTCHFLAGKSAPARNALAVKENVFGRGRVFPSKNGPARNALAAHSSVFCWGEGGRVFAWKNVPARNALAVKESFFGWGRVFPEKKKTSLRGAHLPSRIVFWPGTCVFLEKNVPARNALAEQHKLGAAARPLGAAARPPEGPGPRK